MTINEKSNTYLPENIYYRRLFLVGFGNFITIILLLANKLLVNG